jgi:hypothetical protein
MQSVAWTQIETRIGFTTQAALFRLLKYQAGNQSKFFYPTLGCQYWFITLLERHLILYLHLIMNKTS